MVMANWKEKRLEPQWGLGKEPLMVKEWGLQWGPHLGVGKEPLMVKELGLQWGPHLGVE
jgi:hypothetical protein